MRVWRVIFFLILGVLLFPWDVFRPVGAAKPTPAAAFGLRKTENAQTLLSPFWGPQIRQWSIYIGLLSHEYGVDPDLIAAIIENESNGTEDVVSEAGAIGLMGVMPYGPELQSRPSAESLLNPYTNLNWGVAILTDILQQSGGDVYAALAAYNAGWEFADTAVPHQYAARVLDDYGRAIVARNGISPDIASRWTLAIEIHVGYVSNESLLILGDQPLSGLQMFGEHVVFDRVGENGRAYFVKGYAVPIALVVPLNTPPVLFGNSNTIEAQLQTRLGEAIEKMPNSSSHVLIACLPSLNRLRGHASTRWFAPSNCPSSQR